MNNLDYFDSNYTIIASHMNLTKGNKLYIGDKDNRKCRYCGESEPNVEFKIEAHAIPEFTGNKSLIAYDECDTCNELFSRIIEDHFGKYLGANRTLAQIHGKKGVPTYKGKDGKSRISMENTGLKITGYEDDPIFDIDLESKLITITAHRQPYIPAAVFKCIVKMAVAISPENLLPELSHLTKWIREPVHKYETFPYKPLVAFEQFTPGPMPYPGVTLFLLKRKPKMENVPYLQFVVAFGNSMFQIVVPMPEQDRQLMNKPINLSLFPIPFADGYEYGKTSMRELDLSMYEIVKNESHVMHMGFEHAERTDNP